MSQRDVEEQFRQAWGNFPSGVTVVTFLTPEHGVYGLTASAICSVSLSPPLVLVCVDEKARSRQFLEKSERFVMNFLADGQEAPCMYFLAKGQEDMCWYFSSRGERGAGPFAYRKSAFGYPVLEGSYAYMDCRIVGRHPAGDHCVFVGQVEDIDVPGGTPLVFHQGKFADLTPYGG